MKQRLLLCALLAAGTLAATATELTRQQAMQGAASFLQSKGINASFSAVKAPATSTGTQARQPNYYVFNIGQGQGYVIASGNDATAPVLGYTDSGTFSYDNMPDALRWLLQRYDNEIDQLKAAPAMSALPAIDPANGDQLTERVKHPIAPILKTKWNQSAPYNHSCPYYYTKTAVTDSTMSTKKAVTGCTATALAQVLNHYKHPAALQADIPAYSFTSKSKEIHMQAIPAGTAIDWDNMLDSYSGTYTAEQDSAVSRLMLMVGTAVRMSYGSSSGSNGYDGFQSLVNAFGYENCMVKYERGAYTLNQWVDMLYNELAAGFPVSYTGHSTGGGHAFVIDGYDTDELFHVNWGWGGSSDGYFRISVLDSGDKTGIGASSSTDGYNSDQTMTLNLRVSGQGDPEINPVDLRSYICSYFIPKKANGTTTQSDSIMAKIGNYSGFTINSSYGVGYIADDGTVKPVTYLTASDHKSGYVSTYTYALGKKLSRLPGNGTYRIYPIAKNTGSNTWKIAAMRFTANAKYTYLIGTVTGYGTDAAKITVTYPDSPLTMEKCEFPGSLRAGEEQEVRMTFRNTSDTDEYYNMLYLFASKTSTKGNSQSETTFTLPAGKTGTASFFFTPSSAGTYNITVAHNSKGTLVEGTGKVTITDGGSTVSDSLYVNEVTYPEAVTETVDGKAVSVVYGTNLTFNYKITNQATTARSGKIQARIWKNTTGSSYSSSSYHSTDISLAAGQDSTYTFTFHNLQYGTKYIVTFNYGTTNTNYLSNGKLFGSRAVIIKRGLVSYDQSGVKTDSRPTSAELTASADASAYYLPATITTVTPSANTNTVYILEDSATAPDALATANTVQNGQADNISYTAQHALYLPEPVTTQAVSFTMAIDATETAQWKTFILPFTPDEVSIDGTPATYDDKGAGTLQIAEFIGLEGTAPTLQYTGTVQALYPYLINASALAGHTVTFSATGAELPATTTAKASTSLYTLQASTIRTTVNTDGTAYALNAAGTAFEPIAATAPAANAPAPAAAQSAATATILPYQAWFTVSMPQSQRPATIPVSLPTGIDTIQDGTQSQLPANEPVYNIAGQPVGHTHADGTLPQLPRGLYIAAGHKVVK